MSREISKGYWLSFAKNTGKNLSNKYGQKILDNAEKSTTDTTKTASKRGVIQKTAEATGDLIGNKIFGRITSLARKKSNKALQNNETEEEDVERATPKKRYILPEERKQTNEEIRLVPRKG